MIAMGDEVRATRGGNNNPYCQDNEISWFDWTLVEKHPDILRFASMLIGERTMRARSSEDESLNGFLTALEHAWHGVKAHAPDWSSASHSLALSAVAKERQVHFYLAVNAYWEPLDFELPRLDRAGQKPWHRLIDTFLDAPKDIVPWREAEPVSGATYRVQARSVIVLFAEVADWPA
jgi:glycogen operon protein